jgi:hypothetical protein
VVGILLALQINTWNQQSQDLKKEQRYLQDLLLDLEQDSLKLAQLSEATRISALSKLKLLAILRAERPVNDSLPFYFQQQYFVTVAGAFTPNRTTIDELLNSSELQVIKVDSVRRKVVELYDGYHNIDYFEGIFQNSLRDFFTIIKSDFTDLKNPDPAEILAKRNDYGFLNSIELNSSFGRLEVLEEALLDCQETQRVIREYLARK